MKTLSLLVAALGLVALSACEQKPQPVQAGTLTQHVNMIGADGKLYGTVEFDPIHGGKMYDAQGRLMGTLQPAQ